MNSYAILYSSFTYLQERVVTSGRSTTTNDQVKRTMEQNKTKNRCDIAYLRRSDFRNEFCRCSDVDERRHARDGEMAVLLQQGKSLLK